jgi:hypothetical protein
MPLLLHVHASGHARIYMNLPWPRFVPVAPTYEIQFVLARLGALRAGTQESIDERNVLVT